MTVKLRIIFGFAIILALLCVLSTASYINLQRIGANMNIVINKSNPLVFTLNDLITQTLLANRGFVSATSAKDKQLEAIKINLEKNLSPINNLLETTHQYFKHNEEHLKTFNIVKTSYQKFKENGDNVISLTKEINFISAKNIKKANEFKSSIADVNNYLEEQLDNNQGEVEIIRYLHGIKTPINIANEKLTMLFNSKSLALSKELSSTLPNQMEKVKEISEHIIEEELIDAFDFQETFDAIEVITKEFLEDSGYLATLSKEATLRDKSKNLLISINNNANTILDESLKLKSVGNEFAKVATEKTHAVMKTSVAFLFILSFIAIIVAIITAVLLTKAIINPLYKVVHTLDNLSHGDLTVSIQHKSKDEFGRLANSVNKLSNELKIIVSNIVESSMKLSIAADENTKVSNETLKIVEEQKDNTTSAASAMTQASVTVDDIALNTEKTLHEVTETKNIAHIGNTMVNETTTEIQGLTANIEATASTVDGVKNNVEDISTILDVVRGISEQTNLLALNAAIEAARAGEQGRGFAVVADEVRTLAARTQQSTDEIQKMIETLELGTRQAVSAMSDSVSKAESTKEKAVSCGEQLNKITDSMDRVLIMTTQISSAAEEQSATAKDIAKNLEVISSISVKTTNSANQTSQNSKTLTFLAENLKEAVSNFKLPDDLSSEN